MGDFVPLEGTQKEVTWIVCFLRGDTGPAAEPDQEPRQELTPTAIPGRSTVPEPQPAPEVNSVLAISNFRAKAGPSHSAWSSSKARTSTHGSST